MFYVSQVYNFATKHFYELQTHVRVLTFILKYFEVKLSQNIISNSNPQSPPPKKTLFHQN